MTGNDHESPGLGFPTDWDVLHDDDQSPAPEPSPEPAAPPPVPLINLIAGSWADAVSALAVCTAALLALGGAGHPESFGALPWAAAMAVGWWCFAAAVLVAVRQGTPGMLLAGVVLAERIAPRRLAGVIAAAALQALLLGVPALLGPRRSPIAVAASSRLVAQPAD